jgi:hypothetical protein
METAAETAGDARLASMYRRFTWRILSNDVTAWEFGQLKAARPMVADWLAGQLKVG